MKKISDIDLQNLKKIRLNVTNLIRKASLFDDIELKLLDVAPQQHNGAKEFFFKSQINTLDIDSNSGATYIADLCQNNQEKIPNESFDIILCTEVLEHTLNPFNAVNEIFRMLKNGGRVYASTPMNFRIHGPSPDCWRFTEHGLRELFKEYSSIEIIPLDDEDRFLMPIHYTIIAVK